MVQTGSQLGPYRLQRRIGAGGMAEVFLGQRIGAEGFARTVAIKTILAVGAEEEGIGLFLDEARVASYLEHAAIVQTVDLGFENETLFIVMEYVPGPALSRMIRDLRKLNRFLSPQVVAYIGARVASALDYAYNRASTPDGKILHLVHRDISPQNILITRTGNVKLTDFGVARASVQTHKTRTGQVRGKAAYMAPEQVRAGLLDGRTDVFALALVLYEALTGVRAFQRKTDIMSMRAILTDEMQPIKEINPAVPDDLIAVLKKATAKKPDERYQTAAELGEALQRTYRMQSEAGIEAEIVSVINELFGTEQFSNNGEGAVEAWQPTITAQAEQSGGSHPTPHRISASRLSPKIAAMLQSTPQSSPSLETSSQPFDDEQDVDLGSIAAGTAPSLPGMPVMGATQARAMTSALPADPVAFQEFGPGSTRLIPPSAQTYVRTPSNGTAAIPFHDQSQVRPRGRTLLWAAGAFATAMIVALSILLLYPERRVEELPKENVEATAEKQPAIKAREPEIKTIAPAIEQREEPEVEKHTKEIKRVVRPREEKPREEKQVVAKQDPPPEEKPAEKLDRNTFLVKALAARNKVTDDALRSQLTSAVNDVMAGREPTAADWALVKKAN